MFTLAIALIVIFSQPHINVVVLILLLIGANLWDRATFVWFRRVVRRPKFTDNQELTAKAIGTLAVERYQAVQVVSFCLIVGFFALLLAALLLLP